MEYPTQKARSYRFERETVRKLFNLLSKALDNDGLSHDALIDAVILSSKLAYRIYLLKDEV